MTFYNQLALCAETVFTAHRYFPHARAISVGLVTGAYNEDICVLAALRNITTPQIINCLLQHQCITSLTSS